MSSSVVLTPTRLSPTGFTDGAAHRAELHAVYNQYLRTNADPFYTCDTQDAQALLRPLFVTSWLIDDFMADNDFFGAGAPGTASATLLLSSASSKTAYGAAFLLSQRQGVEVIGLTSAANVAFCAGLGCYHRVLSYEQLPQIDAQLACVYIDFAGDASLRQAIHRRFSGLTYSSAIGATHLNQLGGARSLPGPQPVLFFAPAQIQKRTVDWGGDELGRRLVRAWRAFLARATEPGDPWLVVVQHQGGEAVQAAYAQVLAGQGSPREGHILSLL